MASMEVCCLEGKESHGDLGDQAFVKWFGGGPVMA